MMLTLSKFALCQGLPTAKAHPILERRQIIGLRPF